ncbi:hypothetical protein OIU78_015270 [Salix suchowensis]|nr:hypothetical protein OIU78_015270 [Salix suchowensis]
MAKRIQQSEEDGRPPAPARSTAIRATAIAQIPKAHVSKAVPLDNATFIRSLHRSFPSRVHQDTRTQRVAEGSFFYCNFIDIDFDALVKDTEEKLEYLDFVQVVAIYVVVCFSSVYRYAKENSGPLKPGVRTVEDTVRTVTGPVYDKFHDVPFQLLKFVDHKVRFLSPSDSKSISHRATDFQLFKCNDVNLKNVMF